MSINFTIKWTSKAQPTHTKIHSLKSTTTKLHKLRLQETCHLCYPNTLKSASHMLKREQNNIRGNSCFSFCACHS